MSESMACPLQSCKGDVARLSPAPKYTFTGRACVLNRGVLRGDAGLTDEGAITSALCGMLFGCASFTPSVTRPCHAHFRVDHASISSGLPFAHARAFVVRLSFPCAWFSYFRIFKQ